MLTSYYPEMNQPKPAGTQIDAQLGHYGKHWFLKTPLALRGRGIVHLKTLTANDLVPAAHHKIGWHEYKVTEAAFAVICATYSVASESLL